jgi:hypothetical protein
MISFILTLPEKIPPDALVVSPITISTVFAGSGLLYYETEKLFESTIFSSMFWFLKLIISLFINFIQNLNLWMLLIHRRVF